MEQEIAPSPPWTQRLAIWWRGLFGPAVQQPQDFKAGGDYVPGSPAANPYDPARAMASMGRFGWVYATVGRTGTDLSRLPIRASAGPPSGKAKALKDHPFLRLLDRPSPDVSGKLFRSQLIIDRRLTGNAYAVGEVTVLQVDRDTLERLVFRKPELLQDLSRAIDERRKRARNAADDGSARAIATRPEAS